VRAGFRNIRRTLPEIGSVLVLFLLNTALFTLMGFKLFGGREINDPSFATYGDTLWSMYVLVTTANHPDVMMPSLRRSRWSALFFVVYLVCNLYMLMSVFLAVVYNRFRANLKNEVRESLKRTARLLDEAFAHAAGQRQRIDRRTFDQLCQAVQGLRDAPDEYLEALWLVLDPEESGSVGREVSTFRRLYSYDRPPPP